MTRSVSMLYSLSALVLVACCSSAFAFQLITEDEAKLPDDLYDDVRGGPFPGPRITIYGAQNEMMSPIALTIELKAFGGASINPNSLQMFYQKKPKVNLLPRVRNFINVQRDSVVMQIENAEIPVGHHQILFKVEDTRGHFSEKPWRFSIVRER
ncbi:MAG: hypothetical protein M3436_04165 [Pseudomonadota bacterium]|nr:hypothetical protein [Pseudomonadota bacterium]